MIRSRRLVVLASLGAVVLAACLPPLEQVAPDDSMPWPGGGVRPSASGDPSDSPVYDQSLEWRSCGDLECATIQVPIDWSDPYGPTATLSLNRSQARDPDARLGTILINPGGPGGSGLEFLSSPYGFLSFAGSELLDHYDIVGFDPRGVGQSSPIDCGTDQELDDYLLSDDVVTTEAELEAARQENADFALKCREFTGPLVENVDTVSAARDLDVIREAVGDEQLNYLGFSYGTQLGAVYAALYPENVGRMVLDGALDFLLPSEELSLGQASGFEQALMAYIDDCISGSDCPLPRDADVARRTIADLIVEARDEGIPTGGEDLNGTLMVYGIAATLYSDQSWWALTVALDELLSRGTGETMLYLANEGYLGRTEDGHYLDNSNEAFVAISCLDSPPQPDLTITEFRAFQRLSEEASPTFGWWFAAGAGCEGWPWSAHETVDDLSATADAGPIIVVGTTGDPATPLEWAESLAERMPTASLLVLEGEGHTAYGQSNSCIVDTIDSYFVDGTVPASGKTC
jgi:pimeloyl-ACP methyl ester carboxylesterase